MNLEAYYPTQPKVVKMLLNSYEKGRLAHAYLFEGEKGTPKKELALAFAKLLYCDSDNSKPCDNCINCLRIDHGNHPNIILIEPEGNTLKKEQILYLQKEYVKTTLEEGPKVYIIDKIDKMSISAANSILKFIEEPELGTYTFLLTENLPQILPTIISRCQVLNFQPLKPSYIEEKLLEAGSNEITAKVLSHLTNDFNQALELSNSEEFQTLLDFTIKLGKNYLAGNDLLLIVEEGSLELNNNKKQLANFIDLLLLYLRDLERLIVGGTSLIFKIDSVTIKQTKVLKNIKDLIEAKARLQENVNPLLLLDNLLLELNKVV